MCPYMAKRARDLSGHSFIRALILFMGTLFSWTNQFSEVPTWSTIQSRGSASIELWGHKQSTATRKLSLFCISLSTLCSQSSSVQCPCSDAVHIYGVRQQGTPVWLWPMDAPWFDRWSCWESWAVAGVSLFIWATPLLGHQKSGGSCF